MLAARTRPDGCITDFAFDRWLAHEVEREEEARLSAHVTTCLRCSERKVILTREREIVLQRLPRLSFLPASQEGRTNAPSMVRVGRARTKVPAVLSILAVAALALLMLRPDQERTGTRSKGSSPSISFFIKHAGDVRRGEDGARVAPGDLLRFTTSADRKYYFAILSRDAAGTITVYAPEGSLMQELPAAVDRPLDHSVLLDDVLGVESVVGLFCTEQHALSSLVESMRRSSHFPPENCVTDRWTLYKERPL